MHVACMQSHASIMCMHVALCKCMHAMFKCCMHAIEPNANMWVTCIITAVDHVLHVCACVHFFIRVGNVLNYKYKLRDICLSSLGFQRVITHIKDLRLSSGMSHIYLICYMYTHTHT